MKKNAFPRHIMVGYDAGLQRLWKAEIPGWGASSPVRSDGHVFITCCSGFGTGAQLGGDSAKLNRHLVCLDARDGGILWNAVIRSVPNEELFPRLSEHGHACPPPVTDGERVFVYFGMSGVLAFDFAGHQLWQAGAGQERGWQGWGTTASLMLSRNLLIVNAVGEQYPIRALHKTTGELLWKTEGASVVNASNQPPLLTFDDGHQELAVVIQNDVWGISLDDGTLRSTPSEAAACLFQRSSRALYCFPAPAGAGRSNQMP